VLKKILLVSVVFLIAFTLAVTSFSLKQLEKPLNINGELTTYTVKSGTSLKRVLSDFKANGWIDYPRIHEVWFRYQKQTSIQRGEYEIRLGESTEDIVTKFISGKKILRAVQLIEGKTFSDFLNEIANNEFVEHTVNGLNQEQILNKVSDELNHYEGWFFPDTYLFETGTTDIEILRLAHNRMKDVLNAQWQKRSKESYVTTPYEALILASIIEKETGAAFERPMISGVFTRRLNSGMRLQTDPTIIYGLGETFNGNLTRKHLREDSPYNTYTRKGLPPTPIANPGEDAIFAALNPSEGDSIFFVAKGDGSHQFSTTLQEHNAAVRKYQRFGRRDDYQSAPSAEESP